MKGFDLAKFKKVKEDKDWATLIHKDGHSLVIAKAPLSPIQRKQIQALAMHETPKMAEGGEVPHDDQGTANAGVDPGQLPYGVTPADLPPPGAQVVASNTPASQNIPGVSQDQDLGKPEQAAPIPSQATPAAAPQLPAQTAIAGLQQESRAEEAKGGAEAAQSQAVAQADQRAQTAQQAQLQKQQDVINVLNTRDDSLYRAASSGKIDPQNYWNDHSKIAAGIGVILSGLGQAIGAGKVTSNGAVDAIQQGIARDIDAQKANQSNTHNLYQMNLHAYQNETAANLATQSQLATLAKYDIDKAGASTQGPIAKANATIASAKLKQLIDQTNFKISLLNPTSDNPDPASRVQFFVPPNQQSGVNKEISEATNTVRNAPGIIQAFNQAAEEVRPLTGGLNTSATAFVPGMKSPGQLALQARIGPTIQEAEGTTRQMAFKNVEDTMTPRFGDSDSTIASKKQSLIQYLRSKSAAPNAKSFGIDLTKFPSTNTQALGGGSLPNDQQMQYKTSGGVTYMRGPKGEAIPVNPRASR